MDPQTMLHDVLQRLAQHDHRTLMPAEEREDVADMLRIVGLWIEADCFRPVVEQREAAVFVVPRTVSLGCVGWMFTPFA